MIIRDEVMSGKYHRWQLGGFQMSKYVIWDQGSGCFEWHIFFIHEIVGATLAELSSFTAGLRLFTLVLIISCVSPPQLSGFISTDNKQRWVLGRGRRGKGKAVIMSVTVELVGEKSSFTSIRYWRKKFAVSDYNWAQVSAQFLLLGKKKGQNTSCIS